MANILRTVVLRSSYGGVSRGGMLQSSLESQKLFSFVPNLLLNSLVKYSSEGSPQTQPCNFEDFKHKVKRDFKQSSRFAQLHLNAVPFSKQGILVNTVQKLCQIYEKYKDTRNFNSEVKRFSHSTEFISFCRTLEKKLSTLSPSSLLALIDLENFCEPAAYSLIPNLLNLILENFNDLTLLEVAYLYTKFSQSQFKDDVNWKNIAKACEVYFNERLGLDLLKCNFSKELLAILELEVVPRSAKEAVAKKLLDDAFVNACNQKEMTMLIFTLCKSDHTLIRKDELLGLLRKCSYTFHSNSLLMKLSTYYVILLQKDDSLYDKQTINVLISGCLKKLGSTSDRIKFIFNISLVGHYDRECVSSLCTFITSRTTRTIKEEWAIYLTYILAQNACHETESEEDLRTIRKLLSSIYHSNNRFSFPELSTSCKFLTYLGCDTRELVSNIFLTVMESDNPTSEKNILSLYHLARAYFSSGYKTLPQELLKVMLADEFKKVQPFCLQSLTPYFSSDQYVLKNCTTSDSHCLHFVSLFGADNKPISLSEYKAKQTNLPQSEFLKIEDIQRPPESKMVVFQVFLEKGPVKFLNEPRLTGMAKMNLKMFENLDCSIIFLPLKFFKLEPEAREEFLRTEINEVIGNLENSQTKSLEQ